MRRLAPPLLIATGFMLAFAPHYFLPMDYYRTLTNAFDKPVPRWWTHTEFYIGFSMMVLGVMAARLGGRRGNLYRVSGALSLAAVTQGIFLFPLSGWMWWIPDYEREYQAAVLALHKGISPTIVCLGLAGLFVSYIGYSYDQPDGARSTFRLTPFSLAASNYSRRPFRTAAIALMSAVATAIMLVGSYVLITTLESSRMALNKLGADVIVVPDGRLPDTKAVLLSGEPDEFAMPPGTLGRVESAEGVYAASPQLFIRALPYRGCCTMMNTLIVAIDPETDFTVGPWMEYSTREGIGIGQVVVGRHVMFAPGQRIQYFDRFLRVVGTLNGTGIGYFDTTSFISLDMAYELARTFPEAEEGGVRFLPGEYSAIMVKSAPGTDPDEIARRLGEEIPGADAVSVKSLIPPARAMLSDAAGQLWPLLLATWVFCFLVQLTIFAMIFNERLRESGVLRALGAKRSDILSMFIAESGLIVASGSTAGVALGWLVTLVYRYRLALHSESHFAWMGPEGLGALMAVCLVSGLFVGLCSALLPAWRASRLDPYDAIRSGE